MTVLLAMLLRGPVDDGGHGRARVVQVLKVVVDPARCALFPRTVDYLDHVVGVFFRQFGEFAFKPSVLGMREFTGALHLIEAFMKVSVISGDGPGLLDGFAVLISKPQGAAMALCLFKAQVGHESFNFGKFPVAASGGPFNGDLAAVLIALKGDGDEGFPDGLKITDVLSEPLFPPGFMSVDLLPGGSARAWHRSPEKHVICLNRVSGFREALLGGDIFLGREANDFTFGGSLSNVPAHAGILPRAKFDNATVNSRELGGFSAHLISTHGAVLGRNGGRLFRRGGA